MLFLLIIFFLIIAIIPWKTIEEQKRKEVEEHIKYVYVTEEEMPGFLKAVEKLGGEVINVKPIRKVEGKRLS